MTQTMKLNPVPFKTLMEFCPTEENLELAVRAIARNKKRICADDLHTLDFSVNKLGRDLRVYGAILRILEQQGFLKKVGYVSSSRSACHGRPVMLYEHVEGT